MKVILSPQFQSGELDEEYFRDLPYFDDLQIEMLLDFIECVEQDLPLKGKNKTSWQDNKGNEIPDAAWYKIHHCWHYHSGPYRVNNPAIYTCHLEWNIEGLTSSAVIHYQKLSDDEIYILAYSPKHIPFPDVDMQTNPMRDRV